MNKKNLIDLAERTVATFVQAFGAVVILDGSFHVDALKTGVVAGGLAVIKYAVFKSGEVLKS